MEKEIITFGFKHNSSLMFFPFFAKLLATKCCTLICNCCTFIHRTLFFIHRTLFLSTERFFYAQNASLCTERFFYPQNAFFNHRTLFLSCSADASFFSAAKLASSLKYLKVSNFSRSKLINSKRQTRNLYTLSLTKY